jgi:hypothetical protein
MKICPLCEQRRYSPPHAWPLRAAAACCECSQEDLLHVIHEGFMRPPAFDAEGNYLFTAEDIALARAALKKMRQTDGARKARATRERRASERGVTHASH